MAKNNLGTFDFTDDNSRIWSRTYYFCFQEFRSEFFVNNNLRLTLRMIIHLFNNVNLQESQSELSMNSDRNSMKKPD